MHILLVDDVQDTRQLFGMAFVLAGHRASTAPSGEEAIKLALKYRFDAVLLDIEMPNMNGWKVLEMFQKLPGAEQVPVVLFSAYEDTDNQTRAIESGAYALIRKPILPDFLIAFMENAIAENAAKK